MADDCVIFARIGWMDKYRGSNNGEKPLGAGSYNLRGIGSEADNFLPDSSGRLRGYFAVKGGPDDINLFRVDGQPRSKKVEKLDNVLVIFISKRPDSPTGAGPVIVGWYKNAVLYKKEQRSKIDNSLYRAEASDRDAVLLLPSERTFQVPRATPTVRGVGQSNVCYLRDAKDGSKLNLPWMLGAIEYVNEYVNSHKTKILLERDFTDPLVASEIVLERDAGFSSNPVVRKLIEDHSMNFVKLSYCERGIEVIDHSKNHSYDFLYISDGKERFVEVKGTQSSGGAIILTAKEVQFASDHPNQMELCVVHSITIDYDADPPNAKGGTLEVYRNWAPAQFVLSPLQFACKLK